MLRPLRTGVVALIVLAMTVALVIALSRSTPRYAGHNDIRESAGAVTLEPRAEACQPRQAIPADAASVEVNAEPASGSSLPALAVSLRDGEREIAAGRVAAGAPAGRVRIGVPTVRETIFPGTVCIRNLGPATVALVGAPGAEGLVTLDGHKTQGLFRIAYLRPGSESWFSILGVIAHRFSLAKANWVGAWTFWALGLAMLAVLAICVRIALGEPER